ncbi:MAG: glycerol-3-phosphate dehydrogenase, partial [Gammaproteobacteria bacterium]|nr:glycerol-3-phosphate dehydrogenase [Gammaproteobacteria bacterium]
MKDQKPSAITLLGAGSWGTALALYLARRGQAVRIWSIESTEINAMITDKENRRYLPGFSLPDLLHPVIDLADAVKEASDILIVVPSAGFRQTLVNLKPFMQSTTRLLCATKGLDTETGELLSEIVEDVCGKEQSFAVLSGPSFAREVAAGLPTAVVIASHHKTYLADLMQRFHSDIFCIHPSD